MIWQKMLDPGAASRSLTLAYVFDPRGRNAAGEFVPIRIEHKHPCMLGVLKTLQIVKCRRLPTILVGIDCLGQRLRSEILYPMTRANRDRDQDRQHQEQGLGCPKRKKNSEKQALHSLAFISSPSRAARTCI